ncbi:PREDICTED: UDP-glucuronosyltransferase 2B1-like, partial [Nicrophorus vespilloides]|uniref:UDP-glucuronosyltransferase 2B1-like n=1 Tax=Nicrophorus vespilloides TaxID=110193 RepID=A0ABM1MJB5_NICVS
MIGNLLLLTLSFGVSVYSARILGAFTTPSISHQIVFLPIMKELAARGHEVIIITTDPIKEDVPPTLRQINVSFAYNLWNNDLENIIEDTKYNPVKLMDTFINVLNDINSRVLEHPDVQTLVHGNADKFDLFIVEYLIPTLYSLKHKFDCPMIGITSLDSPYDGHQAMGNPTHPIVYPDFTLPFEDVKLKFFDRLTSYLFMQFSYIYDMVKFIPLQEDTKNKYFGKDYPHVTDVLNSVDMLFINTNHIFHNIRPLTPATISIGPFIHIKPPKPLPKDLNKFLDDAKEGFIYFSLGSNMKSKDLMESTRLSILKTFAELPYKVLWKFESEDLPGKPENVKILKWVPQQDVLRHKNIKVFITQCGLQSLEEGLFNEVPFIGLPVFGDQPMNAVNMVSKGLGVKLNYESLTSDQFKAAILEVIGDPKYKKRAEELSRISKDEPMTGMEKAIFWSEYVIRNNGAQHLKGAEGKIPLYQYYYLDIFVFLAFIFF